MTGGGGCWICNPWCGKCQPTPFKRAVCQECGTMSIFDKKTVLSGQPLLCKKCGHDLTEEIVPTPVRCNYSGLVCAYPCGKSTLPNHDLEYQPCKRNTPPKREWVEAHPEV